LGQRLKLFHSNFIIRVITAISAKFKNRKVRYIDAYIVGENPIIKEAASPAQSISKRMPDLMLLP